MISRSFLYTLVWYYYYYYYYYYCVVFVIACRGASEMKQSIPSSFLPLSFLADLGTLGELLAYNLPHGTP